MRHNRFMRALATTMVASMSIAAFSACSKSEEVVNNLPDTLTAEQMESIGFNQDPVTTTEILVSANDPSVFEDGTNIVSSYGNMYVLSYDSVEEASAARDYYLDKTSGVADFSGVVSIAEDIPEEADSYVAESYADSIEVLSNIEIPEDIDFSNYIAVIDTGADTEYAYSVIGEDTSDNSGHGSRMVEYILDENPNANIVSIKVSDDGFASAANVYAGFELARTLGVGTINFSMSALDIDKNAIVKNEIQSVIDDGIIVIGAAGNELAPVSYFIPGCIDDVIVIGAANPDGSLYPISNYGADYYVVAESSSEATARFTGLYSANAVDGNSRVLTQVSYEGNTATITGTEDFVVSFGPDAAVASAATRGYSCAPCAAGTYYGRCAINISGNTDNGYSGSSVSGFNSVDIPGHSGNSSAFADWFNGNIGSTSVACSAAWPDGERSNGDGYATARFGGTANYKAIVDGAGNVSIYLTNTNYDPDTTTSEHGQTVTVTVSVLSVTASGYTYKWSDTAGYSSGTHTSPTRDDMKAYVNSKYQGKVKFNDLVGSYTDYPSGQKFRGDLTPGTNTPTPTPTEQSAEAYVYHAGAGKSMDIAEWNDLCAAYGEDYVRSHIYLQVNLNNDGCIVITDIGGDGVYGIGPGEDGKYGPQYYYGPDGTTRVGPDGRAGTADDNTTYTDDINDDEFYTVHPNRTMWSGTLSGLNTHTEGSQIIFEIPVLPTDGVIAAANYGQTTITFSVTETSAFEASHP